MSWRKGVEEVEIVVKFKKTSRENVVGEGFISLFLLRVKRKSPPTTHIGSRS